MRLYVLYQSLMIGRYSHSVTLLYENPNLTFNFNEIIEASAFRYLCGLHRLHFSSTSAPRSTQS